MCVCVESVTGKGRAGYWLNGLVKNFCGWADLFAFKLKLESNNAETCWRCYVSRHCHYRIVTSVGLRFPSRTFVLVASWLWLLGWIYRWMGDWEGGGLSDCDFNCVWQDFQKATRMWTQRIRSHTLSSFGANLPTRTLVCWDTWVAVRGSPPRLMRRIYLIFVFVCHLYFHFDLDGCLYLYLECIVRFNMCL